MAVESAPPRAGAGVLARARERALDLRDALLANARFQRAAVAIPGARSMARNRARALFDLCAGFVYSQVLLASVRTGLIAALADGPQTAQALAARTGLSRDAAKTLLDAATALDLATRRATDADGAPRWGLGGLGAALRGAPGVEAMIEHHALLYRDLADPVALLRGEAAPAETRAYWSYVDAERPDALAPDAVAEYSSLMASSQPFVAEETLDAVSLRGVRKLLDVGGGEGAFLSAAARRWSRLKGVLFDLPAVAERARARFADNGLSDRLDAVGGSFFEGAPATGADAASLIRVLYDHPDDRALEILRTVRAAVPAGALVIVSEPMADTPGAAPVGDAYFGMYLLAMGGGRPRTPREIIEMLTEAGFHGARLRRTRRPLLSQVVVARG